MDPQQMTWLTIAIVSLIFSALFSGTEIAYITTDRVRMELDVKKGGIISRIINRYFADRDLFISMILVGNNIMLVVYGMGAAYLLEPEIARINDNQVFVLIMQTLISTAIILLTGEFFPKAIFRINPYTSLKLFAPLTFLFYIVLYPLSAFTSWLSKSLMRLCGLHTGSSSLGALSVGELNNYIEKTIDSTTAKGEEEKLENEVKIFHNALDFSSTQLRDCMLPRNEIVSADIDTITRDELSALFTSSGRSKIIVYSGDIDNIVGYIHVSELFDPAIDWKKRVKPVIFAPETLLANKMMRRLLSEKRSLAIVVDEFGGTSGIVTLEDLVEEIFGDFEDEHDKGSLTAREVSPGIYEFSGRIEVRRLNDEFRLDIPEDDEYQTLAGYLLFSTGALPAKDETITLGNLDFKVTKRTATRLEEIHVERHPDTDAPE